MSTHAGFSTALRHPAVAAGGGVPVRAPRPAPHTQRRRRHGPCAPPTSHAWHAPGGRLPMSEGGCGVGGEGKRGGGAQGGSRVAQRDSLVPPGRRGVARGGRCSRGACGGVIRFGRASRRPRRPAVGVAPRGAPAAATWCGCAAGRPCGESCGLPDVGSRGRGTRVPSQRGVGGGGGTVLAECQRHRRPGSISQ